MYHYRYVLYSKVVKGSSTAIFLTLWMLVATPSSADGSTVVTGAADSTQPLEIAPSTDPTSHDVYIGTGAAVAYIKEMPTTRVVTRVTIGDIARRVSCTSNVGVTLKVVERARADWSEPASRTVQSTGDPLLTSVRSDVVFTIPPTTFVQGRAYVFLLTSKAPSVCAGADLRTWAHNAPLVGAGPDACQRVIENATTTWRMWHDTGQTDAVPCPDGKPIPGNFDPTMPTGWLLVEPTGNNVNSRVVTDNDLSEPPGTLPWCGNYPPDTGIKAERWRSYNGSSTYSEYVCRFPQFSGLLDLPLDGYWYHGGPWRVPGRNGAPRDVHLRLEPIDYDALVRKFRPELRFDGQANYWNASPATLTDHWANVLRRGPGAEVLFQHRGEGDLAWGLETLVTPPTPYPDSHVGAPLSVDYIDAVGDHKDAADAFRFGPYDNAAYARTVHDATGALWIQYWFFYYYNELNVLGIGDHEGDWEMVQYRVTEGGVGDAATYAQHSSAEAEACPWSKVEKTTVTEPLTGPRTAPVVYVARGSQASYFVQGVHVRDNRPDDTADGIGEHRLPSLNDIDDVFPIWVRWPGTWGSDGPASPANQGDKWSAPNRFHGQAGACANPDGTPR